MKFKILSPAYPYRGGIANFASLLYKHLSQKEEVDVINFLRQYPKILFPGKSQLEKEKTPLDIPSRRLLDSVNPINWIKIGKLIQKEEPDWLIIKFWMPFFGPALGTVAKYARKNKKTKIALLCHNIIPHEKRSGDESLTKYLFKHVDKFIVLSSTVEEQLKQFVPNADYKVLYHPVYSNFGDIVSQKEAKVYINVKAEKLILFFGFIREYKGLDILIKALPKLNNKNIKLVVAGEFYSNKIKYEELIREHNLEDRIILKDNFIPSDDVKYYFSAADLVVLPYRSATQSGIIQVSNNFCKPVISTKVGGLGEIVHDGENGYLVEPENPDALAEKINYFFESGKGEELSEQIAMNNKKYSWENFTDQMLDFLKS